MAFISSLFDFTFKSNNKADDENVRMSISLCAPIKTNGDVSILRGNYLDTYTH